jgi:hypothetical protein
MSEVDKKSTILYKCPYCVAGRFTAEDGWDGAVAHIRQKHTRGERSGRSNGTRRKRSVGGRSGFDDPRLLEGPPPSYNEIEELMA